MKKILLTSCGIIGERLVTEFKKLFTKEILELKLLYIPVAADGEDGDKTWLDEEYATILELGIKQENILEYKLDYDININNFDAIYMIGGNTEYLLKMIRKTNFDKKIHEAIENGVVYIGSSAGSMVLGANIYASNTFFKDEKRYLKDDELNALNIFNGSIIPHFQRKDKSKVDAFKRSHESEVYGINDEHAILIIDNEIKEL